MSAPWRGGIVGIATALAAAAACYVGDPARSPLAPGGSGGTGGGGSGPCAELGRAACEGDCRWLVPGCGERPLPYEGCFPVADCRSAPCEAGYACVEVQVDPCGGRPCAIALCGVPAMVCITPQLPCDGAKVGDDAVCRGPGGTELPVSCCMWSCDTSKVLCKRAQPYCPPGERVSVVGTCYGPCVPEDRCLPTKAAELCEATGGTWDPGGCGHTICGESVACFRAEPGCHCGPLEIFDEARGCVFADRCLCTTTGGTWDEWACGHYRCGVPNSCEAIIPGCDCGPRASFVAGRGCVESAACGRRCDLPREFCIMMSSCRWFEPGCGQDPLPEAGCYPASDCRETGCEAGEVCKVRSINPCAGLPCDACGMEVGLCMR